MPMTQKIYTVNSPASFHGLWLPLPPNSLVFLCAANRAGAPSPPPGVLLISGVHYTTQLGQFFLLPSITLNSNDLVVVVTFS